MIFNKLICLLLSSTYLISSTIAMDNIQSNKVNLTSNINNENLVITKCNNICLSNNINKILQIDNNNSINFKYDINKNFAISKCYNICIPYQSNNHLNKNTNELNNNENINNNSTAYKNINKENYVFNTNKEQNDNEDSDSEQNNNNPALNKNIEETLNNNEQNLNDESNNNEDSDSEQNNNSPALNKNIEEESNNNKQNLNDELLGELLKNTENKNNTAQNTENKSNDWDIFKDLTEQVFLISTDDKLNSLFSSKQFKIIEHANKILLKNNINEIYNKFGVTEEILSIYKNYHSEILASLNTILKTKIKDMPDATNNLQEVCDNVLLNSYKKLHGENDNLDIDEIADEVYEEEIKSEHDLQGMNILKVLTHLCVTIDDICEQNHAALHQALLSGMKNLSYFAKANAKLFKIFKLFGILEK